VKPADLLANPLVAERLDWRRRSCASKVWAYAVLSGDDPVRLRSIRFLLPRAALGRLRRGPSSKVAEAAEPGMTRDQLKAACVSEAVAVSSCQARPAHGIGRSDRPIPVGGLRRRRLPTVDSSEPAISRT
jgi:hypothetical protein